MLLHRVITALVLLAVLLPALFMGAPVHFVACAWILLTAAAWEWARLCGVQGARALAYGALFGLLALALYGAGYTFGGSKLWAQVWVLASAAWVLAGSWALARGVAGWSALGLGAKLIAGLAVLLAAWLAVVQSRQIGVNFLLSALVMVWVADIGAYAGGKALSKHFPKKLAPAISPGKTWVGAASGALCSVLVALLWVVLERHFGAQAFGSASLPLRLMQQGILILVLGVLAIVALAIVGDLFESLLKRAVGAKDSSALLPGHGGVLDRIDALLPALPLALMLGMLWERAV